MIAEIRDAYRLIRGRDWRAKAADAGVDPWEKIVVEQVRLLLLSPEIIVQTWRSARKSIKGMTESEVRDALQAFDPLWNQLFPAEQSRIIQLLVERVDVLIDRVDIKLRIAGITSLIGELCGNSTIQRDAA